MLYIRIDVSIKPANNETFIKTTQNGVIRNKRKLLAFFTANMYILHKNLKV
jgi:hypothetical protein